MLKKTFVKRICLALFCLLILLVLYLFPKVKKSENIYEKSTYTVKDLSNIVYLLDKNDKVARLPITLRQENLEDKIKELITYMSNSSIYSNLIPNGFKPILPEGVTVISTEVNDGNLKINLSKELLNLKKNNEVKALEALIYTLTSLDNINSITLLVEGNILTRLPNSKEILPNPLDRTYGINKKYDINSIKDTTKTTIYYLSKNEDNYYYVPVTKVTNDQKEKIEVIIKELKSSRIYDTSLMSYLSSDTTLKKYNILDKEISLEFNNAILSGIKNDKILEEVTYAINLSIKDAYDVDKVMYYVDNTEIANFDLKRLE